jgi:hypothetical protein
MMQNNTVIRLSCATDNKIWRTKEQYNVKKARKKNIVLNQIKHGRPKIKKVRKNRTNRHW